jgi:hypothetical protein
MLEVNILLVHELRLELRCSDDQEPFLTPHHILPLIIGISQE